MRLLHAFDIELGRILLCKEGYQGTAEEVAATAGVFDAKIRDVLLAAVAAKQCEALPVVAVPRASKMRKQVINPILAEFTADGQLAPARAHDVLVDSARIPWAYEFNGSGRAAAAHGRVLMALSLAAAHLKYPETQDLEVVKTDKSRRCVRRATFQAARCFCCHRCPECSK